MSEARKLNFQFKCSIQILAGPHAGKEYLFEESPILVGRGIENHIVLANDTKTSRSHLEIRIEPDGIVARSLSKTNPTFINGTPFDEHKIPSNSKLFLGETELSIEVNFDIKTSKGLTVVHEQIEPKPSPKAPPISVGKVDPVKTLVQSSNEVARNLNPQKGANSIKLVQPGDVEKSNKPPRPSGPVAVPKKSRPKPPPQASVPPSLSQNSSMNFYIVVGVVLVLGFFLFSGNKEKAAKVDINKPRLSSDIDGEFRSYDELIKEFDSRRAKMGTRNFQMAQENFVKGFRDYRQGQYARAKESFQVVINLDSENEMARRYFQLAKMKFDEMVKFHMLQGKRYHDKKNWRLCKNGYFSAMTMLQNNQSDPLFIESERYYKICSSAMEGRF